MKPSHVLIFKLAIYVLQVQVFTKRISKRFNAAVETFTMKTIGRILS